ncbi:protein unc-93 homolog A-like [Littorina saxatilis]|uniref:protein unc-93 homolog A-like n=1 Tax=Littorina saxatilis TaxID=31220 RepID=UPI0038B51A4A
MNIGVLILTSLWRPDGDESSQLLLYTAMWGIVDGTIQSQVQAVVGRYAREERETAMTAFRVMQGVGLVASFLISLFTRNLMTSLYVALPLHVLGFLGLILTTNEVSQRERSVQEMEASPQYSPQCSPTHGAHENSVHGEYCDISGEV